MANPHLKRKGFIIQLIGLLILLAATRGFFIFKGDLQNMYFPGLIVGVILFVACLFWGVSLIKRSHD